MAHHSAAPVDRPDYYSEAMSVAVTFGVLYAAGLVWGAVRAREWSGEALAALVLWPLGPAAFVLTVLGLLGVAAVVWPAVGVALVGAAVLAWWFVR